MVCSSVLRLWGESHSLPHPHSALTCASTVRSLSAVESSSRCVLSRLSISSSWLRSGKGQGGGKAFRGHQTTMILTIGYPCAPPGSEPMGNGALLAKRRQAGVMCKHQVEHKFIHVTATLRCPHTFLRRTAWSAATAVRRLLGPSGAPSGPASGSRLRPMVTCYRYMVFCMVHLSG